MGKSYRLPKEITEGEEQKIFSPSHRKIEQYKQANFMELFKNVYFSP